MLNCKQTRNILTICPEIPVRKKGNRMACVKDLLELDSLRHANLAAGRGGLYRTISWPNVAQTPSIREWLVGGDVIIITGIGVDYTVDTLLGILREALEAYSACLIIYLCDDYIPALPSEILSEANERNFPIFTIPWDTLIANMVRDISQLLLMERYQNEARDQLIEELLFRFDTIPSESLLTFIKRQQLAANHAVLITEWPEEETLENRPGRAAISRQQSSNLLCQKIREQFPQTLYLERQQFTYLLVRLEPDRLEELSSLCTRLFQNIQARYPVMNIHAGIGQLYKDPLQLCLSTTEARKALGLCHPGHEVVRFDELGLYQLLIEIPDQSRVREFAVSHLKPLLDYDLESGKNFLRTLEVYLHCNCSINQTAQQLFVHRNTLSYQIERIQALLNVDLESAEIRNTLFNCLKIFRFCQK